MSVVEDDFNARSDEIDVYLKYLMDLEAATGIDVSLMATMKASAMLMIYNLMESTMTNSIGSIYDHLKEQKIGFYLVDDRLREMVLKCVKNKNPRKLVIAMREKALDIAVAAFEKDAVFSGNVDSRKIREVWDDYGISRTGSYEINALLEVKEARNDLAHGEKSFSELGRYLTVTDLSTKFFETKDLLYRALKDVEIHIGAGLKDAGAAA